MTDHVPRTLIAVSLLIAVILQLFELPYALALVRPMFVPLVLVYWAMTIPQPTGLTTAFLTGIVLDVLLGSVLGQHALGLTLIVFVTLMMRGWLTLFPVWQEAAALALVWLIYAVLMFWIDGATGHEADPWLRWTPIATTSLAWPLAVGLLNRVRRHAPHDPLRL